jgi:hypothetical protein
VDPETGQLTPLFHPRIDHWDEHFECRDGEINALRQGPGNGPVSADEQAHEDTGTASAAC